MSLYARRVVDVWGGVDWILHDQGIAHPLVVVSDIELEKFIEDVKRQREQFAVVEIRKQKKKLVYRCRNCSFVFGSPSERRHHEIETHQKVFPKSVEEK
jgi:hypothetical protein